MISPANWVFRHTTKTPSKFHIMDSSCSKNTFNKACFLPLTWGGLKVTKVTSTLKSWNTVHVIQKQYKENTPSDDQTTHANSSSSRANAWTYQGMTPCTLTALHNLICPLHQYRISHKIQAHGLVLYCFALILLRVLMLTRWYIYSYFSGLLEVTLKDMGKINLKTYTWYVSYESANRTECTILGMSLLQED